MCEWDLFRLSESLDPIVPLNKTTDFIKNNYKKRYQEVYYQKMAQRLGLLLTKEAKLDFGTHLLRVQPEEFRAVTD